MILSPPPTGVFLGHTVVLTCTVILDSSMDGQVTVDVEWFNPFLNMIDSNTATMTSSLTYTSNTTVMMFMTSDLGSYTCNTVVTSTRSFTTPSDSVSSTTDIILGKLTDCTARLHVCMYVHLFKCTASAPSTPVITVIAETNSLSFAWSPLENEVVTRYEITALYVGDCPEIAATFQNSSSTNFSGTSVQFTDLQEFSNYSLSVTAVNDAGSSETSTLVATTLSGGKLFMYWC